MDLFTAHHFAGFIVSFFAGFAAFIVSFVTNFVNGLQLCFLANVLELLEQQLAEELRAEYMEGKGAAAVGTRWAASGQLPQRQTRTRRQCRSERAANRTKCRTLEMPQARTARRAKIR